MNARTLLILSLALNAGLAVLYVQKSPAPATAPEAAKPATADTAAAAKTNTVTQTVVQTKLLDWRQVESEDYRKYIANLRAIGCPKETIKDIIVADVNKLFEERRKALKGPPKKYEFWKTGNPLQGMMASPELVQKQQDLAKEKHALLKELLGEDVPDKPEEAMMAMNPFGAMLDFLPEAKQTQVLELMQKYQAKMMKSMGNGGAPDAEDLKQLKSVQKDMDDELTKLMTPQEKLDYDLRMSQTAMMMRMQLTSFEPNEQEFLDIFKLKKQLDDQYTTLGMPPQDKDELAKYNAAKKEMDDQLKESMGADRFKEYQLAQDYNYQAIAKVAQREGLPKEAATKVYDMKKAAEDQAKAVRKDQSLSADQRTAALQAIRTATEQAVSSTLGEKGFKSYQQNPAAYWMKGISPDPKQ